MKKIYLLPFNSANVKYSFDKDSLVESINIERGLPGHRILEIEVENELADKLTEPFILKPTYQHNIPSSYYDKPKRYLENPPEWFLKEGKRIYVIFDIKQRCFWSPSGNNLNSIKKSNPDLYLSDAIRVEIDSETYINLHAYLDWTCDNF